MIYLRSIVFNGIFIVWGIGALIAMLPFYPFFDRHGMLRFAAFWSRSMVWMARHVLRLDYELRGLENLPDGACILASKHQSAWDTMAFFAISDEPVYVIKKELMDSPVYGWYATRAEMIRVDREGGIMTLKRLLHDVARAVGRNQPVIIFPEGTRTVAGERLPYQPGVAALYARIDVPLIPVALNSGMFWGRREATKLPGTIVVEFLPAMAKGIDRKKFLGALEETIETNTRRLEQEAAERFPATRARLLAKKNSTAE